MKKRRHWLIYVLKFLLHLVWIVSALAVSYFVIVFGLSWEEKYSPKAVENVEFVQSTSDQEIYFFDEVETFVRIATWDIGNACRGAKSDYYREGGNLPFPEREIYQNYLQGILSSFSQLDYTDIILLQNVDSDSRRSRYINQHEMVAGSLPYFGHAYSLNAVSPFVMFPLLNPEGKKKSGMSIFSKLSFEQVTRYALPPVYLPLIDPLSDAPCFQLSRFSLRNGTFLVVLNIQNIPLRQHPGLRLHHLQIIKSVMLEEYAKGNFVVAGGNWQVNPDGYDFTAFTSGDKGCAYSAPLDSEFFPSGWQIVYDNSVPSKRFCNALYSPGKTKTTISDFFIVSPNIEVNACKTVHAGFENSDHNPVILEVYIPLRIDSVLVDETIILQEN
jgi:hypothetical protein